MRVSLTIAAGLCVAACGQSQPQRSPNFRLDVVPNDARRAPPPPPARHPPAPTINPKSSAAAEELVRGFTRLLDGGRFDEAYMLLGPNAPARSEFDRQFSGIEHLRVTAGSAGDQEGTAGSIYVSVPLAVSGEVKGKTVDRSANAILRRVNDVPGSTEARRRWHIERIEWKDD